MKTRVVASAAMFLLVTSGCGSASGDPADARSLAGLNCRTVQNLDVKKQAREYDACIRDNLSSAMEYTDCLADRGGEFAVESVQNSCIENMNWSPYDDVTRAG